MSHDELLDFFAKASPEDVGEIIATFSEVDEAKLVATLGDINRRKATELIGTAGDYRILAALEDLPEAAEAISRKAARLRWAGTGDAGRLERVAPSPEDTEGYRRWTERYCRTYMDGRVYWCREFGAQSITSAIAKYHEANGTNSKIGFPTNTEFRLRSPFGTEGSWQIFEYALIFSSKFGIHASFGEISDYWISFDGFGGDHGEPNNWLGFPLTEETQLSDADAHSIQRFEGGVIYSSESGAFAVRSALDDYLAQWPGYQSYPLADEVDADVSPYQTTGRMQRFKYFGPVEDGEEIVYSSDKYGINEVYGAPGRYYAQLGGTGSWLGFPKSDQTVSESGLSHLQEFEGGSVFWRPSEVPVTVPAATMEWISREDGTMGVLGCPVSEEQPMGAEGSDRIQFFENGIVTFRDGKREMWLRRSAELASPLPPGERDATSQVGHVPS
jgi:hypothetical protein